MSLVEINWNPGRKELRNFGIIALAVTAVASAVLCFFVEAEIQWVVLPPLIGIIILVVCLVSGKLGRLIYLAMSLAALPIGLVISVALLAAFYFLLLTPVAVVFRLFGRDLLNRRFEPDAGSYWIKRSEPEAVERYFRQF